MKKKQKDRLRESIYITGEALKWDDSVDNLLDYQQAVQDYNAVTPIREHLKCDYRLLRKGAAHYSLDHPGRTNRLGLPVCGPG